MTRKLVVSSRFSRQWHGGGFIGPWRRRVLLRAEDNEAGLHRSLRRRGAARGVVARQQLAEARDQLLAILNSVRPGIVAADQEAGGAELVVFEHRLGDGFRCADQR